MNDNTVLSQEQLFRSNYHGQMVLMHDSQDEPSRLYTMTLSSASYKRLSSEKGYYLLLNNIELMSEEIVRGICDILEMEFVSFVYSETSTFVEIKTTDEKLFIDSYGLFGEFYRTFPIVDYLRLNGYAMSWNGFEVDEQINKGWIKLK